MSALPFRLPCAPTVPIACNPHATQHQAMMQSNKIIPATFQLRAGYRTGSQSTATRAAGGACRRRLDAAWLREAPVSCGPTSPASLPGAVMPAWISARSEEAGHGHPPVHRADDSTVEHTRWWVDQTRSRATAKVSESCFQRTWMTKPRRK